jgi:hypothetical protein
MLFNTHGRVSCVCVCVSCFVHRIRIHATKWT